VVADAGQECSTYRKFKLKFLEGTGLLVSLFSDIPTLFFLEGNK
jgi:hypothetical protein